VYGRVLGPRELAALKQTDDLVEAVRRSVDPDSPVAAVMITAGYVAPARAAALYLPEKTDVRFEIKQLAKARQSRQRSIADRIDRIRFRQNSLGHFGFLSIATESTRTLSFFSTEEEKESGDDGVCGGAVRPLFLFFPIQISK
jgi:hypothetical protein